LGSVGWRVPFDQNILAAQLAMRICTVWNIAVFFNSIVK
jgi:hypothetical protein